MKIILYTQRVEVVEAYQETRDCADRRVPEFLQACGFLPVPVPNRVELIEDYLRELKPGGIFLTGGNNLVSYGGISSERDTVDALFIEHALRQRLPVFGICRGMQSILDYFQVPLQKVSGHVAIAHVIQYMGNMCKVNSYHTMAARVETVTAPLKVIGSSADDVVEAVLHVHAPIKGIMWHPERMHPFSQDDIKIVNEFFGAAG